MPVIKILGANNLLFSICLIIGRQRPYVDREPVIISIFFLSISWCYFTSSHLRTESFAISVRAIRPIILSQYFGSMPVPGFFMARFLNVNFSPFLMSFVTTTLFLMTGRYFNSALTGFFSDEPRIMLIFLIFWTIVLNSSGVADALWSGPFIFLSSVKCFSITQAPNVAAITAT